MFFIFFIRIDGIAATRGCDISRSESVGEGTRGPGEATLWASAEAEVKNLAVDYARTWHGSQAEPVLGIATARGSAHWFLREKSTRKGPWPLSGRRHAATPPGPCGGSPVRPDWPLSHGAIQLAGICAAPEAGVAGALAAAVGATAAALSSTLEELLGRKLPK